MNAKLFVPCLVAGVLLFVTGCQTQQGTALKNAQDAYVRLNYDRAVSYAATSLRLKPDYRPAQEFLVEVFPKAVENHLDLIKRANDGGGEFKWDTVVSEYVNMIKIEDEVKSLPTITDKKTKQVIHFDVREYSSQLAQAKINAAEAHYQAGVRLFGREGIVNRNKAAQEFNAANSFVANYKDSGNLAAEGYYQEGLLLSKNPERAVQKQAAKAFKAAQEFMPGYKDAASLYAAAQKNGITRIAIIPFQDKSGTATRFGDVADMIADQIQGEVMNDPSATEFLEIMARSQLSQVLSEQSLAMQGITDADSAAKAGKLLGVYEILVGELTQVGVTPERITDSNIPNHSQVAVGTEKYIDSDGKVRQRPIWAQVSAMLTVHTGTASASISGSCMLIDVQTATIRHTYPFTGKYSFKCVWGTYSGDERALSQESREMASRREETAPAETEMINSAINNLVASVSSSLKQDVR